MDDLKELAAVSTEALHALGLNSINAEAIAKAIRAIATTSQNPQQAWRRISKGVLKPEHPFKAHQLLLRATYAAWKPQEQGPARVWIPTREGIRDTNLAAFMASFKGCGAWEAGKTGDPVIDYPLLQRISCDDPEVFWPPVLEQLRISFQQRPSRIYEPASNPDAAVWLPGARLNIAACALRNRDPDAAAILWAEEDAPSLVHTMSLRELSRRSESIAAALRANSVQPGDAVAINMPMTVTAVIAYLGIVLAGCAVVGIADSFAPAEIASRLRISKAVAIVTQDVILRGGKKHPLYQRVTKASTVRAIVVPASTDKGLQVHLRETDVSWDSFLKAGEGSEPMEPHWGAADDVTNILFSSGTTGEPKAIPWTHVTPLRAGTDAWAQMDVRRGDVVAWPTSLGWMMGPWLVYVALLNGAAIALFHGSPLERGFGEFVSSARVSMLGLVPSIARTWRASDCMKGLDWSCVRCFASTGEASAPEDYHWLMSRAGYKPVIECCGGTELGGGFLAGSLLQPQAPATFSTPSLGVRLVLLTGEEGSGRQSAHESGEPAQGELALVPPFLGGSQRLLNADHYAVYYEGMPNAEGTSTPLRRHGDVFERLPGGYYVAHGRSDDTMNLGGIKVSSVELERACVSGVSEVMEAAAVAVPPPEGGPDRLVMFLVPAGGNFKMDLREVQAKCQAAIRSQLSPLFRIDQVIERASLPRTASNKVMRRVLRNELRPKAKM